MIERNTAYLRRIGIQAGDEAWRKCMDAMEKYGDNRWWLSEDPRERAYYQLKEKILLMSLKQFHGDVEKLLNRDVLIHEISSDRLKQEAERAWRYGVGCTSNKERQERFEESIQDLRNMGKEVHIIEIEGR